MRVSPPPPSFLHPLFLLPLPIAWPFSKSPAEADIYSPTPLPTQLGIHRLYTIPTYRSIGIAEALLDAACAHTIYACPARPEKGQVAFSQPTQSGARMMRRWGRGGVRVFVDDESQL